MAGHVLWTFARRGVYIGAVGPRVLATFVKRALKILITGGAGFVGRWLMRQLPTNVNVIVVDSLVREVHGENPQFPPDVEARATCIRCDVRDTNGWKEAVAGADVVVHLAALTGTGQSMYQLSRYIEHNVLGTSELCEVLAEMHPKPHRVVLASSRAVCGEGAFRDGKENVYPGPRAAAALKAGRWELENAAGIPISPIPCSETTPLRPASIYGMTKMWQEQLIVQAAEACGVDHLILRLQNVYGPLQELSNPYTGILGALTTGIVRRGRVELFEDGNMTRDFVFVGDVARAFLAGIECPGRLACTLNVGSGRSVTLHSLTELLAELTGRDPMVDCRGRYRVGDVRHASADMSTYESTLGPWRPATLRDGLTDYLNWFMEQPEAGGDALDASLSEMSSRKLLLECNRAE